MNTISTSDLFGLFANLNGATIINITTLSAVRMRKTGNPFVESGATVTKLTKRTCQFGYSYQNAVNNRLDKAGVEGEDFKSQPLAWGEWAVVNKIIAHKGKYYARCYANPNSGNKTSVSYFVNGIPATESELATIKQFEQTSESSSSRQAEAGLTENQVKPMNIDFGTIEGLKVNGTEYSVLHPERYALAK